jgi:hypothetical protein
MISQLIAAPPTRDWQLALQTCLGVACYARCQPGSWDMVSSWFGLEPGGKVMLPPGLLLC